MTEPEFTREISFKGRKIQAGQDVWTTRDGTIIRSDVIIHPGAVAILPIVDDQHVCLIRNRRPVVGDTLWEIPAGTLESQEEILLAAKRELAEETGYTAAHWEKLIEFYPSPGIISEKTHLYLARQLTPGPMSLEPDEELEPVTVSWADAMKWVMDGSIRDAKTMVALLWFQKRNNEC